MRLLALIAIAILAEGLPRARGDSPFHGREWDCNPGFRDLSDCIANGGRDANSAGDTAMGRGQGAEKNALKFAGMGDQVGEDHDKLLNQLNGTKDKEPILAKSYLPPEEMREIIREHGLKTNRDLRAKGEKVQKELYEKAKSFAAYAKEQYTSGEQALSATNKLGELKQITDKRVEGMNSVAGVKAAAAPVTKGDNHFEAGYGNKAESGAALSSATGNRVAPEEKASKLGKKTQALAPATYPERKEKRNGLRERLKKLLAKARDNKDLKEAEAIEGKLADLEAEEKKDGPTDDRVPASFAASGNTLTGGQIPFSDSSTVQTDQAIGRIISEFESQRDGEKAGYDQVSVDISLFERIKVPIRRCLSLKCLGG